MNKIYKIEFDNYIYYGSTKQKLLSQRQSRHNYNLKHNPKQKLYKIANENNIEKLNCILLEECEEIERYYIENKYIKNNNDKIILNDRLAFANEERKKEIKKKYAQSEKGKIAKAKANKKYNEKNKKPYNRDLPKNIYLENLMTSKNPYSNYVLYIQSKKYGNLKKRFKTDEYTLQDVINYKEEYLKKINNFLN